MIGRSAGRLYVTAPEENAVKVRDDRRRSEEPPTTLVQDDRLRWPDTLAEGPDGSIYVTTSRIQELRLLRAGGEPDRPADAALAHRLRPGVLTLSHRPSSAAGSGRARWRRGGTRL